MLSSYQYTYDAAVNQLTKRENKGIISYEYDTLNRLSKVTEPEGKITSYLYDKAGNRVKETAILGSDGAGIITDYTYNEQNRLIMTKSNNVITKYLYDHNGNQLSKSVSTSAFITEQMAEKSLPNLDLIIKRDIENGTGAKDITLYIYDHYNRLTKMKFKHTTASYRYNAQGYRVQKTINEESTGYLYEADKVVLETGKDSSQKAFRAYGNNLLYRSVSADEEMGAQKYYYLYNAHGDVTALIDMLGNIAASYEYDAFGTIINQTGNADNSIKYAGYQQDEESGLYYLNARYYDSTTARFITEDSYRGQANDPLSLNLYQYCSGNPIKYDDPTGHWTSEVHKTDTYTIAYESFCNYIETESNKIVVYKKDKKGKDTKKN